ncbi:MAG: hypothetical protein C0518_05715 [Opitutus sp.]|nr:hypothetical protein [Opitutus sp.]
MNSLSCFRLLLCLTAALFLTLGASAQTQAGAIKAVKITGEVFRLDATGAKTPVTEGQSLIETDTVETGAGAGVVLVFMNGSSVKLAENSRLAVEEFKMDPLAENISVAGLQGEPSLSKTRLNLAYGEMVGNVKKLNTASQFDVKTPVGAAGIRGTTFRILLRFEANGQVAFQLSTSEGRVVFAGTVQVAGTGETTETGAAQEVEVAAGQEVTAVAQVNTATGTVTAVQVTAAQPISEAATQAITAAVTQAITQATQSTTFTQTEQQQAAQQTTTPGNTPSDQSSTNQPSTQEQQPKPTQNQNQTTPPTVLDTTARSGSG